MASSRKKQDENNVKTLRELAALPQNKFCCDCGQRGPTYVNVTVGSFVCTKCSGILRGLTPPHRVKSISMATFTADEIDTIRTQGNDYCRKVWLGLHEGNPPAFTDEQQVRDFMIEKYEKRRYYLENNMAKIEVPNTRPVVNGNTSAKITNGARNGLSKTSSNNNVNGIITNGTCRSRPEVKQNGLNNNLVNGNSFAVDFDKADIFSNTSTSSTGSSQNGFADFEHNQMFNVSNANDTDDFSIFDLQFTSHGPTLNQVPLFPKCAPSNRWSMPTSTFNAWQTQQQTPLHPQNGVANGPLVNSTPPPADDKFDKYAALKDLDNEMKQQQQHQEIAWSNSNTGSTGSLYSSSTNTGSVYSSPSPQGSIFGSPSQGQFASAFPDTHQPNPFGTTPWPTANGFSNGFSTQNGMNGITNGLGSINGLGTAPSQPGFFNPFREQAGVKANGFQPVFPSNGLSNGWGGNPFKVNSTGTVGHKEFSNPFLESLRKNVDSDQNSFICKTNDLLNPFKAAYKEHVGALTTSSNPNNPFL